MDFRLTSAILIGKSVALLNRLTGTGATAAPGLYALKFDPNLVKKLTARIKNGNIVISGTNGKTTTSRLAADILSLKFKIIHNRQGSNLLRGIASTLISKSDLFGNIDANLAIWETDEATLPQAIEHTQPKKIVLLNLFRDQLDRYGEVDTVRAKWQKSLSKQKLGSTLILNADDPGISFLARGFEDKTVFFGVEDKKLSLPQIASVADIKHCLNCEANLTYTTLLSAHMGSYSCSKCSLKRPKPSISASNLKFKPDFSTSINLSLITYHLSLTYNLPGLYNAYNILAACALANSLKIGPSDIKKGIAGFSSAFGRFQSVQVKNKSAVIFLIKNPAGANEVIRTISLKNNLHILAILNDKIADGRDVSWIWDTNWEILKPKVKSLAVSGTRCWDMATRFKYADFNMSKDCIYENINYSLEKSLDKLDKKDTLIILPTYTAMLEVQKYLKRKGIEPWHTN